MKAHNKLRALHQNTRGLVWDKSLAKKAQRWSEENLKIGSMTHERINGQGENIFWSSEEGDCVDAALAW